MDTTKEVSFSSFLAACLMKHNDISYVELSNLMAKFELDNNINFSNDYNDYNYDFICNFFIHDECGFELKFSLDETLIIDGMSYSLYDYFYNFTNSDVRKFFDIPEKHTTMTKGVKK